MNAPTFLASAVVALLLCGDCAAAEPTPKSSAPKPSTPKPSTPKASTAPRSTLDKLDWMTGAWGGQKHGAEIEEHWTNPKGGLMVGMHRDVLPNGDTEFEFLRIEQTPDGLVYLASPGGIEPTPFKSVEIGEQRVVFENPQHDFPQRILYWREGENLLARIEGNNEGEKITVEWRFAPLKGAIK